MATFTGQTVSRYTLLKQPGADSKVDYEARHMSLTRALFVKLLILTCACFVGGVGRTSAQGSIGDFDLPIVISIPQGIAQDRSGAIWFIDYSRLYIYDGYSYRSIQSFRDSLHSVIPWTKTRLTGGRHEVLCVTGNGDEILLFFVDKNTTAECRIPALAGAAQSSSRITCVIEGSNGVFWIGTQGGTVFALNPQDCSFKAHTRSFPAPVRALCEDQQGGIWGAAGRELCLIETPGFAHASQQSTPSGRMLSEADIATIACGKDGRVWVCLSNGLFGWLDRTTHRLTFCEPIPAVGSPRGISSSSVDSAGTIWIAARGSGLLRWDPSHGTWEEHLVSRDARSVPVGETVKATMVDRTGILWAVGHSFGGIARYIPEKGIFHSLVDIGGHLPATLQGPSILAARVDHEGTLWLTANFGGIAYRRRGSEGFQFLRHHPGDRRSLSNDAVTCMYELRSGELWIGTLDGINVLDRNSLTFTHVRRHRSGGAPAGADTITAIYEDSRGQIWVGHNAGADRFDPRTGKFRPIIRWPPASVGTLGTVAFFLEDRRENLWIATADRGVLRFNLQREDTIWYREDPETAGSLPHNNVETLCEDPEGRIWLGTEGGLAEYDYGTGKFANHQIFMARPVGSQPGMRPLLQTRITAGIIPDGRGNLWFSTVAGGLVRFEIATKKQRAFTTDEGVVVRKGARHAFFRAADGTIYCGGVGGMTWFHPDDVRDSGIPPTIVISEMTVLGRSLSLKPHTVVDLRLDPQQNTISFGFAALDYGAPDRNQFEYVLEGVNPAWIRTEGNRNVTFASLDPGDYLLRVRGSGREGLWSTQDCIARFAILPPWWRTTWAYIAYAVLAIAFFFTVYRLQLRQMRLKQEATMEHAHAERLAEVDRLKSRFFANISHEFRTPLTLILGPAETIASTSSISTVKESAGIITRNARRLLHLVNQLLDLSRFEAGQMKLKVRHVDLSEIICGIGSSFESIAARRNIRYTIGRPVGPIQGWCDPDAVEKILANLLSNAFKYTNDGGTVALAVALKPPGSVEPNSHWVTISVTDSGVGIPANLLERIFDRFYQVDDSHTREHEGVGIGLALTKELVELHRGSISVQSEVGRGSSFTVQLPLDRERYSAAEITERDQSGSAHFARASGSTTRPPVDEIPGKFEPMGETQRVPETEGEPETGDEEEQPLPLVLIVEDNADMRRYIGTHLAGSFKPVMAEDGLQGVQKAVEIIPDLIISDVMMPKRDGIDLCRALKQDERTSHIPIILLTAKADLAHKLQGLEIGADDYLTKPFDMEELTIKVKSLIEQRRRLRERFRSTVTIKPSELAITSADEQFLKKAIGVVERHMAESEFNTRMLAEELALGRMQLYRKVKGLTGDTPSHFIRSLRMQRAAELLRRRAGNVSEIGYEIGFSNPSHFARVFREQFGMTPSEYADKKDP